MKGEKIKSFTARLQVLGVHCIVCAAVLLAVLLFRLAGGSAFGELRRGFHEAAQDNILLAAVVSLFEGETAP